LPISWTDKTNVIRFPGDQKRGWFDESLSFIQMQQQYYLLGGINRCRICVDVEKYSAEQETHSWAENGQWIEYAYYKETEISIKE